MSQIRVFHLLQQAHSALFRAADRALKHYAGLTASQQAVLFVLMMRDGAPITLIADQLQMGKSSLTGLVDRMEKKGLVKRSQSEADARSFQVFIEDKGRELAEQTLPVTKQINAGLLAPFSKEERDVIKRFLDHVADNSAEIVTKESNKKYKERV